MTPTNILKTIISLIGNIDHSRGNGPNAAKLRGDMLNSIRDIIMLNSIRNKEGIGSDDLCLNLGRIDFPLLRKQKTNVLKLITQLDRKRVADQDCKKFMGSLEGIIALIDRIQDEAVKVGIPETKVLRTRGTVKAFSKRRSNV